MNKKSDHTDSAVRCWQMTRVEMDVQGEWVYLFVDRKCSSKNSWPSSFQGGAVLAHQPTASRPSVLAANLRTTFSSCSDTALASEVHSKYMCTASHFHSTAYFTTGRSFCVHDVTSERPFRFLQGMQVRGMKNFPERAPSIVAEGLASHRNGLDESRPDPC